MTKPIIYMTSCLTLGDFFLFLIVDRQLTPESFAVFIKTGKRLFFSYRRFDIQTGKSVQRKKRREREWVGNRRGMKKQKIVYFLQALAKELSKFP